MTVVLRAGNALVAPGARRGAAFAVTITVQTGNALVGALLFPVCSCSRPA